MLLTLCFKFYKSDLIFQYYTFKNQTTSCKKKLPYLLRTKSFFHPNFINNITQEATSSSHAILFRLHSAVTRSNIQQTTTFSPISPNFLILP